MDEASGAPLIGGMILSWRRSANTEQRTEILYGTSVIRDADVQRLLHPNETAIAIKHLKIMQCQSVKRNRDSNMNGE